MAPRKPNRPRIGVFACLANFYLPPVAANTSETVRAEDAQRIVTLTQPSQAAQESFDETRCVRSIKIPVLRSRPTSREQADSEPKDHAEELNRATSAHIQHQQLRRGLAERRTDAPAGQRPKSAQHPRVSSLAHER